MRIRKYELTFGRSVTIQPNFFSPEGALQTRLVDLDEYFATTQFYAYVLTQHNLNFTISKDAKSTSPNQSKIVIYNIKDEIADYIHENQDKNLAVLFKAGYEDEGLRTLFKGTISSISDVFQGTDRQTTLFLSDGGVNLKETTVSRVYPKGTKVDTIVNDLLTAFGAPKDSGAVAKLGPDAVIKYPYTASGGVGGNLKRLADRYKMVFSVQDGVSHFMPVDARSPEQVAYISESTGLLGAPQPINTSGTAKQGDTPNNNKGVRLEVLLNGAITPNKTIWLKSRNFDTALKVSKVTHTGVLEGNDWKTIIEAEEVPYEIFPQVPFKRVS